jgi:hypothetical protein
MPLASATATSPQQDEQQLGMNGWQSWLASPTPTAQGSQSAAATLYPQSPQTASATTATGTNLTTTSTSANSTAATGMPAAIDPTILSRLQTAYADYRPGETSAPYWQDPATGLGYHARFGEPGYNGEGAQLTRAPITGYSVGNYDTATGGNMRIYDTTGKDTGQSEFWERDKYAWTDTAAMAAMASFVGAFAAAAAGGATTAAGTTSTGPNFATGFTDTGTAGGVAGDAYAGSGAVTGTTGGVTTGGSSLLTGPTSVNADYSLLTGTDISQSPGTVLEGNSGGGLNVASRSGEGLTMNTSPNMTSMGGGQGITTTGAQTLGDSSSFINDPANMVADAGKQVVSEPGIYTPEHPYTPDLGDPASPINGGTNPWPAPPPKTLWDMIKDVISPGDGGGGGSVLPPAVIPPIVQALFPPQQTPLSTPPPFVPPQPMVGAGSYTSANAQGGAAGSLQGVAATLLTSKDTFGYGKSMLA